MPNFVDSLRLNSIFPQGGNFGPTFDTSPNIDAISKIAQLALGPLAAAHQAELQDRNNLMGKQRINQLQDIAMQRGMQQEDQVNKPQNVVLGQPAIGALDAAKLKLEEKDLSRKTAADRNREDIQRSGVDVRQQNADTAESRMNIYHQIADRKDLTDSQKMKLINDARMGVVNAQQTGANTRNAASNVAAGERNAATITGAKERQDTEGTQRLTEIALQNSGKSLSPEQQLASQKLSASKLVRDRLDLAPFIKTTNNGSFAGVMLPSEDKGPTQQQYDEINRILSGTNKDINLDNKFNQPLSGESKTIEKLIPGTNKYAISTDGGVTWKAK